MIPGAASYRTLDKIEYVQQAAARDDLPDETRTQVADALARIEAGAPVHPIFEEVRGLVGDPGVSRDAQLDELAKAAIARAKAKPQRRKTGPAPVAGPTVWTTRSFLVIWGELTDWWTHYDPAQLATELTDEQIEMFLTIAAGTTAFAAALSTARSTEPSDAADPTEDADGEGEVRHLRAL